MLANAVAVSESHRSHADEAKRELDGLDKLIAGFRSQIDALAKQQASIRRTHKEPGWLRSHLVTPDGQNKITELSEIISRVEQQLSPYIKKRSEQADAIRDLDRRSQQAIAEADVLRREVTNKEKAEASAARDAGRKRKNEAERAAVASAMGKTREHADSVKRSLRKDHDCPYCGGGLGDQPHADHVYPVSKGGRSVAVNMVYVCAACNVKKSDMTLAAFIATYRLDRDAIESRLQRLGKEY
jgi:5-methylcytosine-specific restriction endonuclease McrA